MASAVFFVADGDVLPAPHARRAAQDHLRTAVTGHWRATTTDEPHWAGPLPRCPECGVTLLSNDQRRCRNCQAALDPARFEGGNTRFDVWLSDDPDDADRERLRRQLAAVLDAPVRAARKP